MPYFIGFLLWSMASAAIAMTSGLTWLVALRLILGMGEAVVTPSSMRYISLHFAEKQRGLAVGLYMTGTKLGPAVGFPLSAYLVTNFGWQSMFVMVGIASLLWLIPWMLWVKSTDIAAQPKAQQPAAQKKSLSFGQLLTSPVMWGIILGTYCYMYFVYYCMTWMPLYFKETARHEHHADGLVQRRIVRRNGGRSRAGRICGGPADRVKAAIRSTSARASRSPGLSWPRRRRSACLPTRCRR